MPWLRTDSLDLRWHALACQAEVFRLTDRLDDAEHTLHEAIATAERKENLAAAQISRAALGGVRTPATNVE